MRLHTLLCVLYKTFYIICVPFKLQRGKKDLIFTDVYTCAYIYICSISAVPRPLQGAYVDIWDVSLYCCRYYVNR